MIATDVYIHVYNIIFLLYTCIQEWKDKDIAFIYWKSTNERSLTDTILTILNQKVRSPTNAFFVFFVKMASPKHKWWAHTSAKQFAFIPEEYCSINKDRCSLIANNTFHRSLSNIHYQCIHLYIKRPKVDCLLDLDLKTQKFIWRNKLNWYCLYFQVGSFLQWNINLYILYIENMKKKKFYSM